jgi:hypothetical protein
MNFVGPNVAVTRSGTVIDVTHTNPPFPADGIGVYVTDEGIPQGTGTTLDFVGAGVTASRSGSVVQVNVPGGGAPTTPVTGTVVAADEGSILGSVAIINMRGAGVTATRSGTYLDVNIPGGAGGGGVGVAPVNFGGFNSGSSRFSYPNHCGLVMVSGQAGIAADSTVNAWLAKPVSATAEHSQDEHLVENLQIRVGDIAPGTGFFIYGTCTLGGTYGNFNVYWQWN